MDADEDILSRMLYVGNCCRKIDAQSEAKIIQELEKEAKIIQDKSNPVRFYNYSYTSNGHNSSFL